MTSSDDVREARGRGGSVGRLGRGLDDVLGGLRGLAEVAAARRAPRGALSLKDWSTTPGALRFASARAFSRWRSSSSWVRSAMRRLMSLRVALNPRFWDICKALCASSACLRFRAAAFSAASAAARPAGDCCAVRRMRAAASVAAAAACVSAAAWRVAGTVVRQAPTSVMPSPRVWTQGPPASNVSSRVKSRSSVNGASSSGSRSAILAACLTALARWTAAASFRDSQRCSA